LFERSVLSEADLKYCEEIYHEVMIEAVAINTNFSFRVAVECKTYA